MPRHTRAPAKISPELRSKLRDCAGELRAFVQFGDYALDMLPRVAHGIFTHFKIPQDNRVDAMMMARVPFHVMTQVNNRLPIALSKQKQHVGVSRAGPGSSSRHGSSGPAPRR
jgi:hypothetical protein